MRPSVVIRTLKTLGTVLILLLAACTSPTTPKSGLADSGQRPAIAALSQIEANTRKESLAALAYQLSIVLDDHPAGFSGKAILNFEFKPGESLLTIDFTDGKLNRLLVNGQQTSIDYNGYFITLPAHSLRRGENRVEIEFQQSYSRDGAGLYRFVDPLDNRVYIYSDFEPYNANRVFPHFDQPDLKARFTLQVSAPSSWQIISTTREKNIVAEGDRRLWFFPPTAPISSYVFSLHAGEFVSWEDPDFRYPLRLFARASIAKHIRSSQWLDYTRRGFDYFETYFDFPYPFTKYDQLLVPDYNQGAMENVGAVTFSEQYAYRGSMTHHQLRDMVETIYHEMAHMWFGDISTMAWWNGLWLNESFASLMAYLALLEQAEFKSAWHPFFLGYKRWAYREDELVTTHPIELPVADTARATTLFDGITYGKGASVLKQLNAYLGASAFRDGVREYLHNNAYGNTELADFISALSHASSTELEGWSQRWLYASGLNRVEAVLNCKRGKIQSLKLVQSAPSAHPVLREQQLQVALFRKQDGRLVLAQMLPVRMNNAAHTEVPGARGLDCPTLVYPNYDDWGYVKVLLDEPSINTIRHHINTLQEPLQRSMIWNDLWQMTRDAELPLGDFLQILASNLQGERDTDVARSLLRSLQTAFAWLQILPQGDHLLQRYERIFEPMIWAQVNKLQGDARQTWFDAYVALANSATSWRRLTQLLTGEQRIAGFELDQDRRWAIVIKLREFSVPGSESLLQSEAARDQSARGVDNALRARVIAATAKGKSDWLDQATRVDEHYKLNRSRNILRGLYPASQRYLQAPVADAMIARLPEYNQGRDINFSRQLGYYLIPRLCQEENVARLASAIEHNPGLNPALAHQLLIAHQQEERCVRLGALIPSGQ